MSFEKAWNAEDEDDVDAERQGGDIKRSVS